MYNCKTEFDYQNTLNPTTIFQRQNEMYLAKNVVEYHKKMYLFL